MNSGKRGSINTVLSILLMVACVSMLIFGVILVRAKLLQNTQDLGMSLAESYGAEEELQVTTFRNFLELGSQYVEELSSSGADTEEIQTWLHSYFAKITAIVGENVMDPYAVIDGAIVAANPWEGNGGYD